MSSRFKIPEPPEWFSLSLYTFADGLDPSVWYRSLGLRAEFRKNLELAGIADVVAPKQGDNASEIPPWTAPSLKELWQDYLGTALPGKPRSDWMPPQPDALERSKPVRLLPSNRLDDIIRFADQNQWQDLQDVLDLLRWETIGTQGVLIDLDHPDENLLREFKDLLIQLRKTHDVQLKRPGKKVANVQITESILATWRHYRILATFDLDAWAFIYRGKAFSHEQLAHLLFTDKSKNALRDMARNSRKTLENALAALPLLHAQINPGTE